MSLGSGAEEGTIGVDKPGPLSGVHVVAVEQSVAGPIASRVLADMGAQVVKVEPPPGDFARHWDSHVHGVSSYFSWLGRRKRSIALKLHEESGRAILERLLGRADILVFNLSVSAAERLDLSPERLRGQYPQLIACQITGYGRSGATRNRKAYDMLLQAETGLLSLTGDDQGPVRIGVSLSDIGTGLYAATLILGALYERVRSGSGRFIDLSMFEVMTEFAGPNLTAYANGGVRYQRNRTRHHNIVPYGIFACSNGYIAIAIEQDAEWRTFCNRVLGLPELGARPDLATNAERVTHRAEVESAVEKVIATRPREEWQRRLDEADLAYGLINNIDEVWSHPVESDLGLHGLARLADGTLVSVPRSPAERAFDRLSTSNIPNLDQHRTEILSELGGQLVR